jgi:hypothetical protein
MLKWHDPQMKRGWKYRFYGLTGVAKGDGLGARMAEENLIL